MANNPFYRGEHIAQRTTVAMIKCLNTNHFTELTNSEFRTGSRGSDMCPMTMEVCRGFSSTCHDSSSTATQIFVRGTTARVDHIDGRTATQRREAREVQKAVASTFLVDPVQTPGY